MSKVNSGRPSRKLIPGILVLIIVGWFLSFNASHIPSLAASPLVSDASLLDYRHLSSHCENISTIGISEYTARQTALAKTLHALNASAYIAEPGANTHFYGNFSKTQWHLSERPLLLIISPVTSESRDGQEIRPRVTVLTPKVMTDKHSGQK